MKKIVIFASGTGSNAEKILLHFKNSDVVTVGVYSNKADAKVLDMAQGYGVATFTFGRREFENGDLLKQLVDSEVDLIVLAGFLWKIPNDIVERFPLKIVNIHPSLLPKYGGRGMHGMHVHRAVFENKEVISGITIHYVNENYDEGAFIFQESVDVSDCLTPEAVGAKVLVLEHRYYPMVIEKLLID